MVESVVKAPVEDLVDRFVRKSASEQEPIIRKDMRAFVLVAPFERAAIRLDDLVETVSVDIRKDVFQIPLDGLRRDLARLRLALGFEQKGEPADLGGHLRVHLGERRQLFAGDQNRLARREKRGDHIGDGLGLTRSRGALDDHGFPGDRLGDHGPLHAVGGKDQFGIQRRNDVRRGRRLLGEHSVHQIAFFDQVGVPPHVVVHTEVAVVIGRNGDRLIQKLEHRVPAVDLVLLGDVFLDAPEIRDRPVEVGHIERIAEFLLLVETREPGDDLGGDDLFHLGEQAGVEVDLVGDELDIDRAGTRRLDQADREDQEGGDHRLGLSLDDLDLPFQGAEGEKPRVVPLRRQLGVDLGDIVVEFGGIAAAVDAHPRETVLGVADPLFVQTVARAVEQHRRPDLIEAASDDRKRREKRRLHPVDRKIIRIFPVSRLEVDQFIGASLVDVQKVDEIVVQ